MPKKADALAVRQAALIMLRAHGVDRIVRDLGMCVTYSGNGLDITFRNPFKARARPSSQWVIEAAIQGLKVAPALPYGLAIWIGGSSKVFDMGWDDREEFHVVTFKRGGWEASLMARAANIPVSTSAALC